MTKLLVRHEFSSTAWYANAEQALRSLKLKSDTAVPLLFASVDMKSLSEVSSSCVPPQ